MDQDPDPASQINGSLDLDPQSAVISQCHIVIVYMLNKYVKHTLNPRSWIWIRNTVRHGGPWMLTIEAWTHSK
jgi:hypothetical protein